MAVKKKSIRQKKALIIAGISVVTLGILGTIAYNMDALNFNNLFHLGDSVDEYTDIFTSPTGWVPCQEIDKTAVATNRNSNVRYARMKIDKYWRTEDTQTPSTDHTTTDLPLTWDDNGTTEEYGIINTQNDNDWELLEDGWYYYKTPLQQNESTRSLLKSVTFNCKAKLVENGTSTTTATGQSAESVPTAYAGSHFHVYVTMQLSDEEWERPQYHADCNSNLLYDEIACQTNGRDDAPDNTVFFTESATKASGNGNGVNTLAAHAGDFHPVYYFRGEVDNNYVIWANTCWKAVRTTTGGGVKLIYDGEPTNGACTATGSDTLIPTGGSSNRYYYYGQYNRGIAAGGYMTGKSMTPSAIDYSDRSGTKIFSKGVTRDGYRYDLDTSEGNSISGVWDDVRTQVSDGYYYFCRDGSAICGASDILYLYDFCSWRDEGMDMICSAGDYLSSVPLIYDGTPYDDIEAVKEAVFSGTVDDSAAKSFVDQWYASTIATQTGASAMLEDAAFCNDQSVVEGSLAGVDIDARSGARLFKYNNDLTFRTGLTTWSYFGAYNRNMVAVASNLRPSVDCPNQYDRYTESSTTLGNGALTYRVGLLTADEVTLAGTGYMGHDSSAYLNSGVGSWTMTPMYYHNGYGMLAAHIFIWRDSLNATYVNDSTSSTSGGFRPVVSLKKGTVFTSGTGLYDDPYIVPISGN